ncbi:hypothetical protein Agabi119p4_2185 [Agaricus bisporus var. burnettii]|uniref:Uncharacterized protein n=1 Tax=Agaricus bisporus var. burnettii TaxID=192524 RepID=A0A8H7F8N9_AGABI|nr:hypothetical protein Agabi119p4_2185 [Agaricus bisporus var. burnettii]
MAVAEIPVELQNIIVENVSDPADLHRIAQVSRDFNFLSFSRLCSLYNVHPHGGILRLDKATLPILSSLAISLSMVGETFHFLRCDLTSIQAPDELLKQTRSLCNFVKILGSVQTANVYTVNAGPKEWEDTMAAVYDTLASKASDLHIRTLAQSTTAPSRNDKLTEVLQESLLPSADRIGNSRCVKPTNLLESCNLQTLPTFLQSTLLYQLNAAYRLTSLTFRYISNCQEWDDFIDHLRLPFLATLTISHCIIPGKTFSTFLNNHPTITSFDFHHNTHLRNNPLILPSGILPRLNKLRTSSEYLIRYFPPLDTFPDLTMVSLPAGDMARDSNRSTMVLKALIPCVNDITLSLEFDYVQCLDHWLRENLDRAHEVQHVNRCLKESDPTRDLSCVKALKLDSSMIACSTDGVVDLLVKWLCIFPALARVFIMRPCLPAVFTRDRFEEFAKSVARGSQVVKTISVEADDLGIWTWCC